MPLPTSIRPVPLGSVVSRHVLWRRCAGQCAPHVVGQLQARDGTDTLHTLDVYLAKRYNRLCSAKHCPRSIERCGLAGHAWRTANQLYLAVKVDDVERCVATLRRLVLLGCKVEDVAL